MKASHSFNTSHVTLYLHQSRRTEWILQVSIHLMLLFIYNWMLPNNSTKLFQYISCYSLSHAYIRCDCPYVVSIHLMLLFIGLTEYGLMMKVSFNTSHVTLYRSRCNLYYVGYKFQYISCYSLSRSLYYS